MFLGSSFPYTCNTKRSVELLVSCARIQDLAILDSTNAQCDVLMVNQCDDDERQVQDCPRIIAQAYDELLDANAICFHIENKLRRLKQKSSTSAWFRRFASFPAKCPCESSQCALPTCGSALSCGQAQTTVEERRRVLARLRQSGPAHLLRAPKHLNVGAYQLETTKASDSIWFRGFNEEFFFK